MCEKTRDRKLENNKSHLIKWLGAIVCFGGLEFQNNTKPISSERGTNNAAMRDNILWENILLYSRILFCFVSLPWNSICVEGKLSKHRPWDQVIHVVKWNKLNFSHSFYFLWLPWLISCAKFPTDKYQGLRTGTLIHTMAQLFLTWGFVSLFVEQPFSMQLHFIARRK